MNFDFRSPCNLLKGCDELFFIYILNKKEMLNFFKIFSNKQEMIKYVNVN